MKKTLKFILSLILIVGLTAGMLHTHTLDDTNSHTCSMCQQQNTIVLNSVVSPLVQTNYTSSALALEKQSAPSAINHNWTSSRGPPKRS